LRGNIQYLVLITERCPNAGKGKARDKQGRLMKFKEKRKKKLRYMH
jgi:hypothetical protein